MTFPQAILTQHIAILGKTGAGKSSTAKLLIEQVVAEGARVCILDPIKSDWWGLTSSANGNHAGLPFHILGGPRGHVPLHASAGKAIGEIVASGALPLSIIDMADFEPGGQAKFFVDFAPTLLRKMRGVVYLVIEEAHLFAPKERSGVGAENLSIHWAKTLATAGRSKGVRLVLVTQRTQALHNALLGSCDTLIAHRLTAPADQEPVTKWLKANTTKEILQQVATSLASLKTGQGWICSGEAKLFELRQFPRISTYDNTATPTGDGADQVVKTAPVDPEKLRAIIGDAVKEAVANDPRELKKQIAQQNDELAKLRKLASTPEVQKRAEPETVNVLTDGDRTLLGELAAALRARQAKTQEIMTAAESRCDHLVQTALAEYLATVRNVNLDVAGEVEKTLDRVGLQKILAKLEGLATPTIPGRSASPSVVSRPASSGRVTPSPAPSPRSGARGERSSELPPGEHATLTAALQYDGLDRKRLGILTGYKRSSRDAYIARLAQKGLLDVRGTQLFATDAGRAALNGSFEPLPTGAALVEHWRQRLPEGERKTLDVLLEANGGEVVRERIDEATGYKRSSRDAYLVRLKARGLVEFAGRGMVRASEELFDR